MSADAKQVLPHPGMVVHKDQITNRINNLHFQGKVLLVELRHLQYEYIIKLSANPEICHGQKLRAHWVDPQEVPPNLHQFTLVKIVVPDTGSSLEMSPENAWLEHDVIQVEFPENIQAVATRTVSRHPAKNITAQLVQNSVCFQGNLEDYSPRGMRLKLTLVERQSVYMFTPGRDTTLTLATDGKTVFSGPVMVLRTEGDPEDYTVVVAPAEDSAPRYQPKNERATRYTINPNPDIAFVHPLTKDRTTLPVKDFSILGVAVKEAVERSLLLPGLIVENIELNVFGNPLVTFNAQVVYRNVENDTVTCGLAILDIDVDDHYRLISLVHRAEDDHAYVRLNQDPEKFFDFLFKTGFLYPDKYQELHRNREALVDAYQKLYLNPNRIARCFVYQEDGQISGHISALKIYRNTWLNHHHAALRNRRTGLKVLRQISEFHTKSFVLNPLHMRYVVGIWRPTNDFPSKFFGRFTKELNNPELCSMDTFSYMTVNLEECREWDSMRGPWELAKANTQDIREFSGFYQHRSGGLLARAFDLTSKTFEDQTVAKEYAASGLKRNRHLYAVRYGLDLKALVEVQDTNLGLNLSELTSAVYIYVLDEKMVTPRILDFIQCMVSVKTQKKHTTVMLYPNTYATRYQIETQKDYTVWILNLNVEATDAYMAYLSKYCR